MFRLSRGAEYAVRGVLYLSLNYDEGKVSVIEEISEAQDVPVAYLAKIFQKLSKRGFVKSFKGQKGGFTLAKPPKDIGLLDIIEAMEGPIFLNRCLIHAGYCPRDQVCPVHDVWIGAQQKLVDYLKSCDFEQLAVAAREKQERALIKS